MLPLRISSVLRVSSRLKTFKVPSLHPALQFHSTLIQNERSHLSLEQEAEFERRITEHEKKREERSQQKKKNLLIVTVITTFFAAHAICLWRRRGEFLKANEITPPIDFEAFKKNYLIPGKVVAIVAHPQFNVLDVFLGKKYEDQVRERTQKFLSTHSTGPEKFALSPDVRVNFEGKLEEVEKLVVDAQQLIEGESNIKFEVNAFPSYREMGFVAVTSFCAIACVGMTL